MEPNLELAEPASHDGARSAIAIRTLFVRRLGGRDEFPRERFARFALMSARALRSTAHNARQVRRAIAQRSEVFRISKRSGFELVASLRPELISNDHDWRAIFAGLREHGAHHADLCEEAIAAYLRYLDSRYRALTELALHASGPAMSDPARADRHGFAGRYRSGDQNGLTRANL
jgi:hypothetical protein